MRVNRAKRRLMAWYRYVDHTGSVTTNSQLAGYHRGHMKAYSDVMNAGRYAPIGIRTPWVATSAPGGA